MLNHFEIIPFLIGFFIGVVGILFWKENTRLIYKYPHPSNVNNLVYRDPNGVCYRYKANEVSCDKNEASIKPYPLQEGLPTEGV
jgi:hypothetical protein